MHVAQESVGHDQSVAIFHLSLELTIPQMSSDRNSKILNLTPFIFNKMILSLTQATKSLFSSVSKN